MTKKKNKQFITSEQMVGVLLVVAFLTLALHTITCALCGDNTKTLLKDTTLSIKFNDCIENYHNIVAESPYNYELRKSVYEPLCVDIIAINKLKLE